MKQCMHGLLDCPICHKIEGQCDFGDCEDYAVLRFVHETGRDVRHFCLKHGTGTEFQFARTEYYIDEEV